MTGFARSRAPSLASGAREASHSFTHPYRADDHIQTSAEWCRQSPLLEVFGVAAARRPTTALECRAAAGSNAAVLFRQSPPAG